MKTKNKENELSVELSDKYIKQFYPVYIYDQLEELVGRRQRQLPEKFILLYKTGDYVGHWTCVFHNSEGLNFFDSYGYKPDKEFEFANKKLNYKKTPSITHLFLNSKLPLIYSEYKYQSDERRINTCGRWCMVRLYFSQLTNNQFRRFILGVASAYNIHSVNSA